MNDKKRVLFKNTVMLYILTFSTYFFSFITTPYQTRVLEPTLFGVIGIAQACTVYVQLFLDFGFILSSTEDVARNKHDTNELSRIMSAVFVLKVLLGLVAYVCFTVVCFAVERFREYLLLYQLFFVATFINALLPDFLYRGMEKMSALTYRTVAIKLFFTATIFLFLRSKEQVAVVPLLTALGSLGACVWSYYDVYKRMDVRFVKVSKGYLWQTLKRSFGYFVSRIASTVYSATNTLLIGMIYPVGAIQGYYSSAERLVSTARSAVSPIADSLYPYMVKNKDFKLVKRVLLILMPIILVGCTVVGIYACDFCAWLFGAEYRDAGRILQLLMPVIAITLPAYIMGFPVLSPLGLAKYANRSVVIGAFFHGVVLAILFVIGQLRVETICISTCVTEALVLAIRIGAVIKHRKSTMKTEE